MRIKDFYQNDTPVFSFEFFPPKSDEGEGKLFETIHELKSLNPSFISVTYGAMGTTRDNTLRIVSRIKSEVGIESAAHLTCVGNTQEEIESVLGGLAERGIENIVALRGDPPKGESSFQAVEGGFQYAQELVQFIRQHPQFANHFSLAVAGYPEGHVECQDKQKDLEHLKQKVDEGADLIITQLFFDNKDYFDFVERARKIGIQVPIVAGIMPLTNGAQIQRFSEMCGASIPQVLHEAIEKYQGDAAALADFGVEYATKQCQELLDAKIAGIHFYTLNKSKATQKIFTDLHLNR